MNPFQIVPSRTAILGLLLLLPVLLRAQPVRIVHEPDAHARVAYGAERLAAAFQSVGLNATISHADPAPRVVLGKAHQPGIQSLVTAGRLALDAPPAREGFILATASDGTVAVVGGDDNGILYGCLALARRVREDGRLPADLRVTDAPVMKLRGPAIGMQKTYILPGRMIYEYPYTKELFPFFYDKDHWIDYLDHLADNRMNTLYLWNGHPFASLVKVADYPYALEVGEEQFEENVRMFRFLAEEADRRGIWLVQMFYNILISKPFAERHGLRTQLAAIDPIAADYTRKSIAEFVRQYPNVGLLVCLGEALQDVPQQSIWNTDVILAGVKDGMKAAGLTEEPPVVIRAHATDPSVIMPASLKVYSNLYTMAKYNGESLTTWEPRGVWQERHQAMSKVGSTHVVNVHILANLEPFRYGAQRFIRKSVLASRDRLGGGGIHLYPLAYWNWPDAPDKTDEPLTQVERDWIWFEAWARYAWNPDIGEAEDRAHWIGRLTGLYGSAEAAAHILDAYNDSGESAPRILRRFGITEGNRQTMSLGMTLDQLVDPAKYRPYSELWDSHAPPGERLQEYAKKAWLGGPHTGETPPQIIAEALDYTARAVASIEAAAPLVTKNRAEFERLRNDIHCIRAMTQDYAAKVEAAMRVLRYEYSRDPADMEAALGHLTESLEHFRTLTRLTKDTYHFANSMQIGHRRIPVSGAVDGKPANYHWTHLLPVYEKEWADFKQQVGALKEGTIAERRAVRPLVKADFRLVSAHAQTYTVQTGSRVFTDEPWEVQVLYPGLHGLTGIRFSNADSRADRMPPVEFETDGPVEVLIGYIQSKETGWLQVPELETDALAGERFGGEPLILDAATVDGLPAINVHTLSFPAGRHKLEMRGTGSFVVLGVVLP